MASTTPIKIAILGDASSAKKAFAEADSAGSSFGSNIAKVGLGLAGAFAGAVVGLGAVAIQFDKAYDTIRIGTGATGDALKGLEADFKTVVQSVPTDFESASTAIADLNTRTGQTGPALQELSKNMLEMTRLTGGDLSANIASTTRVFGDWGIATEDQSATLDKLFRASQSTGIGIDQLSNSAVQFGAPLRAMGFNFEQTIALLGKFEKEGVNGELVMGAFRKGLANFAKDGEDAPKALERLTGEIKNAGSATEGTKLAMEVFGTKAGPDMAAAIREGRFEIGDLLDTISNGSETIMGASADTQDFGEKWQMIKNRVFVVLEPLAMKLFDAINNGMNAMGPIVDTVSSAFGSFMEAFEMKSATGEWVAINNFERAGVIAAEVLPKLIGALKDTGQAILDVIDFVKRNGDAFKIIGGIIAAVLIPHYVALGLAAIASGIRQAAGWTMAKLGAMSTVVLHGIAVIAMVAGWVLMGAQALIQGARIAAGWLLAMGPVGLIIAAVIAVVALIIANWDTIARVTSELWEKVKQWTAAAWDWVKDKFNQALAFMVNLVMNWSLPGLLFKHWDTIKAGAAAAWDWITGKISGFIEFAKSIPGKISSAIGGAWDNFKDGFRIALNWIIDKWNGFSLTIPSFEILGQKLGGFTLDTPDIPRFAKGGTFKGLAVVGEEGPELIASAEKTRVFSNPDSRKMLGGPTVDFHPTIHVDARGSSLSEADIKAAVRRGLEEWTENERQLILQGV